MNSTKLKRFDNVYWKLWWKISIFYTSFFLGLNNDFRKFVTYLIGSTLYVWIWQTTILDSPMKKLIIYVNCSIQHLILWDLHQIILTKINYFISTLDLNRSVIHTVFTISNFLSQNKLFNDNGLNLNNGLMVYLIKHNLWIVIMKLTVVIKSVVHILVLLAG